jgi:hypothetical protein
MNNNIFYVNDGSQIYTLDYTQTYDSSKGNKLLATTLRSPVAFCKDPNFPAYYFIEEAGYLCKIDLTGRIIQLLGNGTNDPYTIGIVSTQKPVYSTGDIKLGNISGLTIDKYSNIYVTSTTYGCIIRLTNEGAIQPIAGKFIQSDPSRPYKKIGYLLFFCLLGYT